MEKNGFVCYNNKHVESVELSDMANKYCCVVTIGGFSYIGLIVNVYEDNLKLLDRKKGNMKISREKIWICYELPAAKFKREECN